MVVLVEVAAGNFEKTQRKSFVLGYGRYKIGWKGFGNGTYRNATRDKK